MDKNLVGFLVLISVFATIITGMVVVGSFVPESRALVAEREARRLCLERGFSVIARGAYEHDCLSPNFKMEK